MNVENSILKGGGRVKESAFVTAATNIADSSVTLENRKEGGQHRACQFNSLLEPV